MGSELSGRSLAAKALLKNGSASRRSARFTTAAPTAIDGAYRFAGDEPGLDVVLFVTGGAHRVDNAVATAHCDFRGNNDGLLGRRTAVPKGTWLENAGPMKRTTRSPALIRCGSYENNHRPELVINGAVSIETACAHHRIPRCQSSFVAGRISSHASVGASVRSCQGLQQYEPCSTNVRPQPKFRPDRALLKN